MLRWFFLSALALMALGNASPAREHYHWFPAAPDSTARPWAILLPRAAGIGMLAEGNQYWDLSKWLNARGIDALVIDYDAAERRIAVMRGTVGARLATIVADAIADSRQQSRLDGRCPGIVFGWSRGAEGALTLASTEGGADIGLKAAVVYYPSVRAQQRPWRQHLPVLALQGTGDRIAPAASLETLVSGRISQGKAFDIHLFEGARHRFDVAHPVDRPGGKASTDYDAKASAEALLAIDQFLETNKVAAGYCGPG